LKDQDVQVVQQVYDTKIDNARYLFLPHPRTRDIEEQYRSLTGKYDFVFGHFATLPLFGHEIALNEDLEYRHRLFGHVHIPDKNDPVYLGVPVAQAYGEDSFTHKLACIDRGVLSYLDIPSFLEFKTVSYAATDRLESEVDNVFFVYDIIDAPSVKLAYEKFGNVPIRKVTTLLSQDAPEVNDKNVLEHGRENLIEEFLNQYDKPLVANKLKALFAS